MLETLFILIYELLLYFWLGFKILKFNSIKKRVKEFKERELKGVQHVNI